MDAKIQKQLEEAKELFFSWKLAEAYAILRRFYDRLPFEQTPEHAEYIGIFSRVLAELGKENELNFYLSELERLFAKHHHPAIGYQLGFVYSYMRNPRPEEARKIFEAIIRDSDAKQYHVKAKLMLADYFDTVKADTSACDQILHSITDVPDGDLQLMVEIWRAKVLRDQARFSEAECRLKQILSQMTLPRNWYLIISANVILANLLLKNSRFAEAEELLESIKRLYEGRKFKAIQEQVADLEKKVHEARQPSELTLTVSDDSARLGFSSRVIQLNLDNPADKLLYLLAKKKFLEKAYIVKHLFSKDYSSEVDDKLVYHTVHQVRKKLQAAGIGKDAVESIQKGYRFIPKVKVVKEEL